MQKTAVRSALLFRINDKAIQH